MKAQNHRIRREIIDVAVKSHDPAVAWQLQCELSRIHEQRLVRILDECFSEACSSGCILRIDRLEVDLGSIAAANLEDALAARLGPALKTALSRWQAEAELLAAQRGEAPEAEAHLELLASFAETGSLPWWADTSQPRLVDQTLRWLLQNEPTALCSLLLRIASEPEPLLRLVRACEDAQLLSLVFALRSHTAQHESSPRNGTPTALELLALLRASDSAPALRSSQWRDLVLVSLLQTAGRQARDLVSQADFWPEVLSLLAAATAQPASHLAASLRQRLGPHPAFGPSERVHTFSASETSAETLAHELRPAHSAEELRSFQRAPTRRAAHLELLASFAETGSLPWWADTSQPRLVDQALRWLLQNEPNALCSLLLRIASEPEPLLRLVRACEDAQLLSLVFALRSHTAQHESSPRNGTPTALELLAVLRASDSAPALRSSQWRDLVLVSLLQTAGRQARGLVSQADFWPEVLSLLAAATAQPASHLAASLRQRLGPHPAFGPSERVHTFSASETSAETSAHELRPAHSAEELLGIEVESDAKRGIMADAYQEAPIAIAEHEPAAPIGAAAAGAPDGGAANTDPARPLNLILQRLEVIESPFAKLFAELRSWTSQSTLVQQEALRCSLHRFASVQLVPITQRTQLFAEALGELCLEEWLPASVRERFAAALAEHEEQVSTRRPEPPVPRYKEASAAERERKYRTADFAPSDETCVDNAGLVLLAPFLVYLFERLGLMTENRFHDAAAQHRAVGLLHHAVSGALRPEEYQLLLAKALCGLPLHEVLDFGAEVTEAETEECENLLTAVLTNAPAFTDLSIDELRQMFLWRKGVLSLRDGGWLLRIERSAYDVLLSELPWTISWVKLPFMEAAIAVEW